MLTRRLPLFSPRHPRPRTPCFAPHSVGRDFALPSPSHPCYDYDVAKITLPASKLERTPHCFHTYTFAPPSLPSPCHLLASTCCYNFYILASDVSYYVIWAFFTVIHSVFLLIMSFVLAHHQHIFA